jgi:hypothetical protein
LFHSILATGKNWGTKNAKTAQLEKSCSTRKPLILLGLTALWNKRTTRTSFL